MSVTESTPLKARWTIGCVLQKMRRAKLYKETDLLDTPLNRCLTLVDLILLSMGNMAGAAMYVIPGVIAKTEAGPATFVSYFLAGISSLINGLCYSELCARIPKAGSAYTYTYITAGEFIGFVTGWTVLYEYVLCVASVARGWADTLNALMDNKINIATMYIMDIKDGGAFPTWMGVPNCAAFIIVILFAAILSCGSKLSVSGNSVVMLINLSVLLFVAAVMLYYGNTDNWADSGHGGFAPRGVSGVLAGAVTSLYALTGFDVITLSSEEARDPARTLPRALYISIPLLTAILMLSSIALTLYIPWYRIDTAVALQDAFKYGGVTWAEYVASIGAMLGISCGLFCGMYGLPRIVYAMATDGLIFTCLARVSPRTKVPLIATLITSFACGILGTLVNIKILADSYCVGTLICYTLVNINVVRLRYSSRTFGSELQCSDIATPIGSLKPRFSRVFWINQQPIYWGLSSAIMASLGSAYVVSLIVSYGFVWWTITLLILSASCFCASITVLSMCQQNIHFSTFKVPFVPWLPMICVVLNLALIIQIAVWIWIHFLIWTIVGIIIYFGYGIRHSAMNLNEEVATETQYTKTQ